MNHEKPDGYADSGDEADERCECHIEADDVFCEGVMVRNVVAVEGETLDVGRQ